MPIKGFEELLFQNPLQTLGSAKGYLQTFLNFEKA
jgi:hypothetical protein